jgi:hypothetical protein
MSCKSCVHRIARCSLRARVRIDAHIAGWPHPRHARPQITHGRVAMLAAVGWLVQEVWHPLFGGSIEGA